MADYGKKRDSQASKTLGLTSTGHHEVGELRNLYTKQWDSPARLAPWVQCKQTSILQLPPLPWKIWEDSSLEKNEFPSKKASNTGIWEGCLTNQLCSKQVPGPMYLLTAELSSTTWHLVGQGMLELRSPVRFCTPQPCPCDSLLLLAQENSHLKITQRH
jgi:hypothetical protein